MKNRLKEAIKNMPMEEKVIIVMWDEISLQSNVTFDVKKDRVIGFAEWGTSYKTDKIVDHSNTFMIRGLKSGWKLPLAFNFCQGTTPTEEIAEEIRAVVKCLVKAGLIPVALVCDQGSTNAAAVDHLVTV